MFRAKSPSYKSGNAVVVGYSLRSTNVAIVMMRLSPYYDASGNQKFFRTMADR